MGRNPKKGSPWMEDPPKYAGPFRTNVKDLIKRYGTLRSPLTSSKSGSNQLYSRMWTVPLSFTESSSKQKPSLLLYIFEQRMVLDGDVVICDNCRVAGWNSHPVCNQTYHFILPISKPEINWRAGEVAVQTSILDNQTHLLHGALHINGFGHLLRVNGYEGGSLNLSGRHLMELWTNICTMLKARVVTVEDVSQKSGLPYRLLHAASQKTTWYGKWGYSFCRGPFGINEAAWKAAASALNKFPLQTFKSELSKRSIQFLPCLAQYEEGKGPKPRTLGELVLRVLQRVNMKLMSSKGKTGLTHRVNQSVKSKVKQNLAMEMEAAGFKIDDFRFPACRWSESRLRLAAYVVLNTLSASGSWMSRQDVRDAARQYIGDTGLLDFVLKVMGNQVIGGNLIRREFNTITKVLEYKLEILNGEKALPASLPPVNHGSTGNGRIETNPKSDLKILYNALVHGIYKQAKQSALPWEKDVRTLLDTKQFERNYYGEDEKESSKQYSSPHRAMLRLLVTVRLDKSSHSESTLANRTTKFLQKVAIPYEVMIIPESSTVKQLKVAISYAMKEIYAIFEQFEVSEIISGIRSGPVSENTKLRDLKLDQFIVVTGKGISMNNIFHHTGGLEDWVVDCTCGTTDDDGERMVECERCNRWVHTRCYGYADAAPCPENFTCTRCRKHKRL